MRSLVTSTQACLGHHTHGNSVGNADGEGPEQDDSLVHKSFEVNKISCKSNVHTITFPLNTIVERRCPVAAAGATREYLFNT